jgi:hypothetical protein
MHKMHFLLAYKQHIIYSSKRSEKHHTYVHMEVITIARYFIVCYMISEEKIDD